MKYFIFSLFLLINACLLFLLGTSEVLPLPLGKFLSVQEGIWRNAEPVGMNYNEDIHVNGVKGKVDVYFDEEKSLMGSFFFVGDFFAAIMGFVLITFLCFVVGFGLGDDRIVLVYVIQALLYFLY